MRDSRTSNLLGSLKPKEKKQFGQLLRIGFLKANQRVLDLYDFLEENNFRALKLDRQELIVKRYGSYTKKRDNELRHLLSDLYKLLLEFIAIQSLRKHPFYHKKLVIEGLAERELYPAFIRVSEQLIEQLLNKEAKSANDFHRLMELNQGIFHHPQTKRIKDGQALVNNIMNLLDHSFVLAKLQITCELLNRQKTLSEPVEIQLLDELVLLASQMAKDNPTIHAYLGVIQLLQKKHDFKFYKSIRNHFFKHLHRIEEKEQQILLLYLINYINKTQTDGVEHLIKECFALYQKGLEKGILVKHNQITYATFTNIAIAGSTVKKFKWTKEFIDEYKKYLEEAQREIAYSEALAYWYFNQGMYTEAFHLLESLQYSTPTFTFRMRSLAIRSLYELSASQPKMEESLENRLETFYRFIIKQKPSNRSKAYKNFNTFVKKLISIRRTGYIQKTRKTQQLEKLQQLAAVQQLAHMRWIEAKINSFSIK